MKLDRNKIDEIPGQPIKNATEAIEADPEKNSNQRRFYFHHFHPAPDKNKGLP
jgi:hypothetical protein